MSRDLSAWRVFAIAFALCIPIAGAVTPMRPKPCTMERPRETPTVYDGYATPAWVLKGIALTESGGDDNAVGDDGVSIGRMQINETFHDERVRFYGEYDPKKTADAIRVASCIFQDNYRRLGSTVAAIDAHRKGVSGVNTHGISGWYVNRVIRYGNGGY